MSMLLYLLPFLVASTSTFFCMNSITHVPKRNKSLVLLESCVKKQNQKALCNWWKGQVNLCIRNLSYNCQKQLHQKEAVSSIDSMLFLAYLVLTKAQAGKCHSEASYGYLIEFFNVTLLYIESLKLSKPEVVLMINFR